MRSRLLAFLAEETQTRGATIVYASHIFDGMDSWPTHLCHIQLGTTVAPSPLNWPLTGTQEGEDEAVPAEVRKRMMDPDRSGSRLLELAVHWLEIDKKKRIEKEIREGGKQKRGANGAANGVVTDSEAFYRK